MDVIGSIVVARWYGGVMLGPARFEHMKECAREAIGLYLLQREIDLNHSPTGKKARIGDDEGKGGAEEARKLREELVERDRSIAVLRGLLGEKKSEVARAGYRGSQDGEGKKGDGGSGRQEQSSPTKPVSRYDSMSLAELRRAEKARDATISFILKALEKVEAEIEAKKTVETKAVESNDPKPKEETGKYGQKIESTNSSLM